MDQNLNSSQKESLWALLANQANDAHLSTYNLQRLVNDFPQSGLLQALLVHSSEDKNLKQASVYFNPRSLYKLINTPSGFNAVPDENILVQSGIGVNGIVQKSDYTEATEEYIPFNNDNTHETGAENYFNEHVPAEPETGEPEQTLINEPEISGRFDHPDKAEQSEPGTAAEAVDQHLPLQLEESYLEKGVETLPAEAQPQMPPHIFNDTTEDNTGAAQESIPAEILSELAADIFPKELPEHHETEVQPEPPAGASDTEPPASFGEKEEQQEDAQAGNEGFALNSTAQELHTGPEQETAPPAEPVWQDENIEMQHSDSLWDAETIVAEKPLGEETPGETGGSNQDTVETDAQKNALPSIHTDDEEEKLIIDNIAATDYFAFNRVFGKKEDTPDSGEPVPEPATDTIAAAAKETPAPQAAENQDISRYHDEKMPYTFMWWLDKTRKEHADTYQPYIKAQTPPEEPKSKPVADELQQQYYENIFHITSYEDFNKNTPPAPFSFGTKRKEHRIIERFIKEEPQIKPQSSDKIDNENKAKKSSEDRDELVTETLAIIYSEQMLYHKAISSYRKLMLKFPEKSVYFAGKIEQLEKKTN